MLFDAQQVLCDFVQRILPVDGFKIVAAFAALAAQGLNQAVRMMDALAVSGHLAADDPGGVSIRCRTADFANGGFIYFFDLQGAGGRAVVRTGAVVDHVLAPRGSIGNWPARPAMSSNSMAAASRPASCRGAAASCRPTGRPFAVKPQGMDKAGAPMTVNA